MKHALERLLVMERVSIHDLKHRSERQLQARSVPNNRVNDVRLRLIDAAMSAKISGADLLPAVRAELRAAVQATVRPDGYVKRGDEGTCQQILSNTNVLLLSGRPRCGKSDAA